MTYLDKALEKGYATLSGEGTKQRIAYSAVNHSERFSDPEEQVRAEFWAELIFRYGYEPARIGVEVTVPDRTPKDAADLVVFNDDTRTRPFAVIECKRDGVILSFQPQGPCFSGTFEYDDDLHPCFQSGRKRSSRSRRLPLSPRKIWGLMRNHI